MDHRAEPHAHQDVGSYFLEGGHSLLPCVPHPLSPCQLGRLNVYTARFQSIDLGKYGISPGELKSVLNAVGLEALVDPKHPDAALLAYLAYDADKVEKLLDNPRLLKTPIVRNGRQATVGYCPEVWQGWA